MEREVEKMFCADHVGEWGTDITQMERIKRIIQNTRFLCISSSSEGWRQGRKMGASGVPEREGHGGSEGRPPTRHRCRSATVTGLLAASRCSLGEARPV